MGYWGWRGWPGAGRSGSRVVAFLLHPHSSGAQLNVRGLLMRWKRVKHSPTPEDGETGREKRVVGVLGEGSLNPRNVQRPLLRARLL